VAWPARLILTVLVAVVLWHILVIAGWEHLKRQLFPRPYRFDPWRRSSAAPEPAKASGASTHGD